MRTFIVLAVILAGCATSTKFVGPNGRDAYAMKCGARMDQCLTLAANNCPKGYDIIHSGTGNLGVPIASGETVVVPHYTLAVECR